MSSLNILIQEAQKLHYQLALSSSAVIGHLEGHGVNQDSVYTVAIYEQMGDNTQVAGRLVDQLCSLGKSDAAPAQVVTEAKGFVPGSSEQAGYGVGNQGVRIQILDIENKFDRVLALVSAYDVLGTENNHPSITGTEVAVLMESIVDKLNPIKTLLKQLHTDVMG